jgi:hypothetical protein
VVADALADGVIAPGLVEAIRKAVTGLPDAASIEDRVIAEKILCEAATTGEPSLVKKLGDEIAQRLDPDGDEPKEKNPEGQRMQFSIMREESQVVPGPPHSRMVFRWAGPCSTATGKSA